MLAPPGPVETQILAELAPAVTPRTAQLGGRTLRWLEGGSGSPLVLLHGRGDACTSWFPLLPELVKEHRVIVPDYPGFGQSEAGEFTGTSGEQGLAYFVEPIEQLLSSLSLGRFAIAGHSLGGFGALELAIRGKLAVERLILICAMGLGPEMSFAGRAFFGVGPERIASTVGAKAMAAITKAPTDAIGVKQAALAYELLTSRSGRPTPTAAFNTLFPMFGAAFHRFDRLPSVSARTLLFWGEKDDVFPPLLARNAAGRMPSAQVELTPFGHGAHLADPSVTLPILKRFLAA